MAVALALFASLAYGVSNYVGPRLARGDSLYLLLVAGQSCALLLAGILVLGQGASPPAADAVAYALLAGLGNAGGLVLFYRAAAIGPLSIVTPIGALGAALPVTVGIGGGETVTVLEAGGIVLALAGVVLVARRPGAAVAGADDDGQAAAAAHADRRAAVVLAAISAVFFGVFLSAMAPAAEESAAWAVFVSRISLVAVLVVVAARLGAFRGVVGRRLPLLAVPGLLLFAGTVAYATATREGDLSVVSVLGSLFPVVTVALALGLDRERLTPSQAVGVVGTMAGVVLLSLP